MARLFLLFFLAVQVNGQLIVNVYKPRQVGNKVSVPIALKNNFASAITSAKASMFLLDDKGNVEARQTQWVIAAKYDRASLPSGGTNTFYFVLNSGEKVLTNATSKIVFTQLSLENGGRVDLTRDVIVTKSSQ